MRETPRKALIQRHQRRTRASGETPKEGLKRFQKGSIQITPPEKGIKRDARGKASGETPEETVGR